MTHNRTDYRTVERDLSLDDFADEPRWVAWREENRKRRDGSISRAKIPYDPNHDRQAEIPTNPSTWGTRYQAEEAWLDLDRGRPGGVGIVLGKLKNGALLAGIDLDGCIDPETKKIKSWAVEVLDRFDSYAEVSPSNKGIKCFFLIASDDIAEIERLFGPNDKGGWKTRKSFSVDKHCEIAIDRARYYAVTDEWLHEWPKKLRTVDVADVQWFFEEAGPDFLQEHGIGNRNTERSSASHDQSGSGHGFRFMRDRKAAGDNFREAYKAILADRGEAGEWARRSDERQLKRAWEHNKASHNIETRPLTTRTLDQFKLRRTQWLWWPFIAREQVNCMYGDSGVGKSSLLYSTIARVTNGDFLPQFGDVLEERAPKGSVLIMTAEDSPETGIGPRLKAAGADMSKVHIVGYDVADNPKDFDPYVVLNQIAQQLDDAITRIGDVKLVNIDPLTDFAGRVQYHIDSEARQELLQPLLRLARKHNLAVVYVVHLNKKNDLNAKQRATGAGALINMPRSSVLVGRDPNDYDRRIIVQAKTNLIAEGKAAAFRLTSTRGSNVQIEWEEDWVDMTADELLAGAPKTTNKTDSAEALLAEMLADGPQKETVVQAAAREDGISSRTLRRARDKLKIKSTKAEGVWWLSNPRTRPK